MRRRYYVPEVVQTSGMDCGPAVLASLLQGYGIDASYARLRDACHTNVDGTSIDDLERVASALGLDVSQVMMPVDQVLLPDANLLPAIVVTKLPGGFAHFVLAWRRHGSRIQIMDPAVGRRWVSESEFHKSVYVHEHKLASSTWYQWATSEGNLSLLKTRLRELTSGKDAALLTSEAKQANDWRAIAKLDAATRMAKSLCESGIHRGSEIRSIFKSLVDANEHAPKIPVAFWSARATAESKMGVADESVITRGAVMISCGGRLTSSCKRQNDFGDALHNEPFANIIEPPRKPFLELWHLLPNVRFFAVALILVALALAAVATLGETLMYRAVLDAGRELVLPEQRMFGVAIMLLFSSSILILDKSISNWLVGIGRTLECNLRLHLHRKILKLAEEYLSTRPTSDTAERVHAIAEIRSLPMLCGSVARAIVTLVLTASVIAWIDPASAPIAFAAAFMAVVVPVVVLSKLRELDLCVRTHGGALSLYYYDALMGLTTIRAHHADRAMRREHDALLLQWVRSSRRLVLASVAAESIQSIFGFSLAVWLMFLHAGQFAAAGSALLVAYWALSLPALGEQIIKLVKQLPMHRSVSLRLLEPLTAPEDDSVFDDEIKSEILPMDSTAKCGVRLTFDNVSVVVGGRTILSNVNVDIPAGCHVGIVGVSGAGKSTLLSLLLGWNRAADGIVQVDGQLLTTKQLHRLRSVTTWVDPSTQLWNRSLARNLTYGAELESASAIGEIMEPTDLISVLERLPVGLQTKLGESGCLLSGGEGQRVRFARAALHQQSRLAILDEPFRGLDRGTRRRLLREARRFWHHATLFCVTHDVSETTQFDRVMVIEDGALIEFGEPQKLMQNPDSRFRSLLAAQRNADDQIWHGHAWTRYSLQGGKLHSRQKDATSTEIERTEPLKRNGYQDLSAKGLTIGGVN